MERTGRGLSVEREWLHFVELAWFLLWIILITLILVGLNISFETAQGERNLWQMFFRFFF